MSVRSFEAKCGLSNGTLNGYKKRKEDISFENIDKIVENYSKELSDFGLYIIDLLTFGINGKSILNKEQKDKLLPSEVIINTPRNAYIELKTASGKTLKVIPEGETEIALLNALLEERDQVLEEKNKTISIIKEEKQARIDDLVNDKGQLYKMLNSGLDDLSKVQKAVFAMVRTGQEYEAAIASQGDKKKEAEMLDGLTKLNYRNLEVDATKEVAVVLKQHVD